jgi:RHS repeat-associated protein
VVLLLLVVLQRGQVVHSQLDAPPPEAFQFAEDAAGIGKAFSTSSETAATKVRTAPVSASGEFVYSIALDVPPGRLSMTPDLQLSYGSGHVRDSEVGAGWDLEIGSITRSTLRGFPQLLPADGPLGYDEEKAEFESPSGRLARVSPAGTTGALRFVPVRESSAIVLDYFRAGLPVDDALASAPAMRAPEGGLWIERRPDGRRRYYGADPAGRRAQVVNEVGTATWLLTHEEDADGNSISYEYHNIIQQTRSNRKVPQRVPVLSRVEWGGNRRTGFAHVFAATTTLQDDETGGIDLLHGNTILRDRITRIAVGPVTGASFWTYDLSYAQSPDTGRSLLVRVRRTAPGESPRDTALSYSKNDRVKWSTPNNLPPSMPIYSEQSFTAQQFFDQLSLEGAQAPLGIRSGWRSLDFDGNGLTDFIYHPAGLRTTATKIIPGQSFTHENDGWRLLEDAGISRFGLSSVDLYSDLVDVDGDQDADGVKFYLLQHINASSGGSTGSGTTYVTPEMCSDEEFWNRCGDIDPIRPDMLARLAKAGMSPVDPNSLGGVAIIAGTLAGPKDDPRLLLVHPPKDMEKEVMKAPRLFQNPRRGLPSNKGKGGGGADQLDVRGLTLNWGDGGGGFGGGAPGGGRGGGRRPDFNNLPTGCMKQIDACIDLQQDNWVPDFDTPRGPWGTGNVVLVNNQPPTAQTLTLPGCPQPSTVLQMPMWLARNGSVTGARSMPSNQILEGWPVSAIQEVEIEVHYPADNTYTPTTYSSKVVRDFNAPVGDINGDGRADVVLLKSTLSPYEGLALSSTRFVPRAYVATDDAYKFDLTNPSLGDRFTTSLTNILNGGKSDECWQPNDINRPYPTTDSFNAFLIDVNGDGLPDLVAARRPVRSNSSINGIQLRNGHDVYINRGYSFEKLPDFDQWSSAPATSPSFSDSPLTLMMNRQPRPQPSTGLNPTPIDSGGAAHVDINGDGRLDIVFLAATQVMGTVRAVFVNTGRGYKEDTAHYELPDVLFMATLAPQGSALTQMPQRIYDTGRLVDIDGDGLLDFLRPGRRTGTGALANAVSPIWFRNLSVTPDLLIRIDTSSSAWTTVEYTTAGSEFGRQIVSSAYRPSSPIVSKVRRASGPESTPVVSHAFPVETITLSYTDYRRDLQTSEALGFEKVHTVFAMNVPSGFPTSGLPQSRLEVTQTYHADPVLPGTDIRYPLKGRLKELAIDSGANRMVDRYAYHLFPQGASVRVRPETTISGECVQNVCRYAATNVREYDAMGNATRVLKGDSDGTTLTGNTATETTVSTYSNMSSPHWVVGLELTRTVSGRREAIDGTVSTGQLSSVINSYDAAGHLMDTTEPGVTGPGYPAELNVAADRYVKYSYDDYGLMRRSSNNTSPAYFLNIDYVAPFIAPAAQRVAITKYRLGQPQGTTDFTERYEYDARHGGVTSHVDVNGHTERAEFDSLGRDVARYAKDGSVLATFTYQDAYPVMVRSEIHTTGNTAFLRVEYIDGEARLLSRYETADGSNWARRTWTSYDGFGRAYQSFVPAPVTNSSDRRPSSSDPATLTTFDAFDRVAAVRRPGVPAETTLYEPFATTVTAPRGNSARREMDWRGRLTGLVLRGVSGQAMATYQYTYDGAGRLVKIVDADQNIRRYEFDAGGRMSRTTLPVRQGAAPQAFVMRYETTGVLIEKTTPAGRAIRIKRDELGRPVRFEGRMGAATTVRTVDYDQGTNAIGQRSTAVSPAGAMTYSYDVNDGLAAIDVKLDANAFRTGAPLATGYRVLFDRSPTGLLRRMRIDSASPDKSLATVTYDRDAFGRLTFIRTADPGAVAAIASEAKYDARDRLSSVRLSNGLVGVWDYDAATQRLSELRYESGAPEPFMRIRYGYDDNDNPTSESHSRLGTILFRKEHDFDGLDRLSGTRVITPTSATPTVAFTYSPNGNIRTAGGAEYKYDGSATEAVTSVVDGSTTRRLAYDDDASVLSDELPIGSGRRAVREMTYDAMGFVKTISAREVSAQGQASRTIVTTVFTDEQGHRMARQARGPGATVATVISLAGVAELRPEENSLLLRFSMGSTPVAEESRSLADGTRRADQSSVLLSDLRDSVIATVGASGTPTTYAAGTEYDPWGRRVALAAGLRPPVHGFTGVEPDQESDVYQFGTRLYDATLRRFLSPDPLALFAPDGQPAATGDLNLFAYALNNPVALIDPDGRSGKPHAKQPRESRRQREERVRERKADEARAAQKQKEKEEAAQASAMPDVDADLARQADAAQAAAQYKKDNPMTEQDFYKQGYGHNEYFNYQNYRVSGATHDDAMKALGRDRINESWGHALTRSLRPFEKQGQDFFKSVAVRLGLDSEPAKKPADKEKQDTEKEDKEKKEKK